MTFSSLQHRSRFFEMTLFYSPMLLAVLVMLPRLLSPQFGLLDDGKSIITAQNLVQGDGTFLFDTYDSRFRPLYWLSFAVLYLSIGENVFWFFLLNTIVLCVTTAALMVFLRRIGMSSLQAWASGMLFVLSGPVIENFYTLSKGEWLQVMFIALSLVVITAYELSSLKHRLLTVLGSALLLLFAMSSKETSIVMLLIGAAWFGIAWVWSRFSRAELAGWRASYLISGALAGVIYLVLRLAFTNSAVETSGYTERFAISFGQLVSSGIRWAGWLMRDFLYLVGALLILCIILFRRQRRPYMHTIVDTIVWMVVWIAVYLPWNFMTEYYMLPFAFGAAILAGLVLGDRHVWEDRPTRWIGVFSVGLIFFNLINNYTSARIQLSVDSTNDKLMTAISNLPPESLILVNIQDQNEYTDQIQMQLTSRFERNDLGVRLFSPEDELPEACFPGKCFIVTPAVVNQPLLTVRMGVHEPTQEEWNDSLSAFLKEQSGWNEIEDFRESVRMLAMDFPRLFCAVIKTRSFCAAPSPLLDTRVFEYGWIIYELEAAP